MSFLPRPWTRRTWLQRHAALVTLGGLCPHLTAAVPAGGGRVVSLGTQPLGVPCGMLSALMSRDLILHQALSNQDWHLTPRPFARGPDMLPLLSLRQLSAAFLGDMPTLVAAALGEAAVVGIAKQTATAIVARRLERIEDLRGCRVAYVEASSAHYTLLQGLSLAGLNESHIVWVPLGVDQMVDALERGDIDAFAGWEPASSLALMRHRANRVIFRGSTTDYLVINRPFAQEHPEISRTLVASFVRAIRWMRHSRLNLDKAVRWANEDAITFSGHSLALPLRQLAAIVQRDLLDVPAAPLVATPEALTPLQQEFEFLMRLGKLPSQARWTHVVQAFGYDGLPTVLTQPQRHPTTTFNYRE